MNWLLTYLSYLYWRLEVWQRDLLWHYVVGFLAGVLALALTSTTFYILLPRVFRLLGKTSDFTPPASYIFLGWLSLSLFLSALGHILQDYIWKVK